MVATVNTTSFSMSNMWELADVACVATCVIQPMEQTSYPCLAITSLATRRQGYYIFNVVLPLGSLQLLGCFQYVLPVLSTCIHYQLLPTCASYLAAAQMF